jgi:hypothetical protein
VRLEACGDIGGPGSVCQRHANLGCCVIGVLNAIFVTAAPPTKF